MFVYGLREFVYGGGQIANELLGLLYCLILNLFCLDETSSDGGEIGGEVLPADRTMEGLPLEKQFSAIPPACLAALPREGLHIYHI
jgi:hypothetical protein